MRIGIICGKDDEEYLDKNLNKTIPSKYKINGKVHTDVALAHIMMNSFPEHKIDIILPQEISSARLQKNSINIPVGYDVINAINDDPFIKKFSGKVGIDRLDKIYGSKQNKIFPSYEFMAFLWDKKKYLERLHKAKIPVTPSIFVKDNVKHKKLIDQIKTYKWKKFIIKPIGGTIAYGLGIFDLKECLSNPILLKEYFEENNKYYSRYIIQEKIEGFGTYGEIKSFWINGEFSYAVNTPGAKSPDDSYVIKEIIDPKIKEHIIKIGKKVIEAIPNINFNKKRVVPAMVRIDFTCCLKNKTYGPTNFFVNEIESDIAGTYINFPNVKYPMLHILADAYIKKIQEVGLK